MKSLLGLNKNNCTTAQTLCKIHAAKMFTSPCSADPLTWNSQRKPPSHFAGRLLMTQTKAALLITQAAFSFHTPPFHFASRFLISQAAFSVYKSPSHLASRVLMWQAAFSMTQAFLLSWQAVFSSDKPRSHLAHRVLIGQAVFSFGKPRSYVASRLVNDASRLEYRFCVKRC